MKICSKCKEQKNYSEFPKDKYTKDGLTSSCKKCRYIKTNLWARQSYLKNKNIKLEKNAIYRKNNWQKIYTKRCEPSNKVANMFRSRTYTSIKKQLAFKKVKSIELLGCSILDLMKHLESKFYADMSWENYGSYWHIDHIRPCASFNLQKYEDQKICFHYSNLQPLTAKENLSKGSKF